MRPGCEDEMDTLSEILMRHTILNDLLRGLASNAGLIPDSEQAAELLPRWIEKESELVLHI